jgi:hypothetical protein
MRKPTQCVLWGQPELVGIPKQNLFELIDTYVDDSHWFRKLLKCRECGQLYFYEFYEYIDWVNGNDPQYQTYIPVETEDEINTLKKTASPLELLKFYPRLQRDFPKDAEKPKNFWVGIDLPDPRVDTRFQ